MTEKSSIYEALALFQEKVGTITKDSEGQLGNRKFLYADLATIMAQIQPILTECKLAVSHCMGHAGEPRSVTVLCHWPSGETIQSNYPLTPNSDPQEEGKQLTYFRRYGLSGILNLVTDDDSDAPKQAQQRAAPKARAEVPASSGTSTNSPEPSTRPSTRPAKQCPACGKGDLKDDYPLLQDREDKSRWFHWTKKGGCGWTGNPDEYVETNRIKQGEEALAKASAELQAQRDAEDEAAAAQHGL